jgi:sugar/nucleoside kinase (ribokinase family)
MNQQFLIYGKIIIDSIQLRSDNMRRSTLGGGGPQAAFGMRLWHDSVALLTRSGTDLEPVHEQTLRRLGLDLDGWARYTDLPTPRSLIEYDQHERMLDHGIVTDRDDWFRLLGRPLTLSEQHRQAAGIHLITEFADEPIVDTAFELQRGGALLSLEPLFDDHSCPDRGALLELASRVDLVTPDWPAASTLAGAVEPANVLRFWAALGPRAVAIRRGVHGSYVWDADHRQAWHIPALPVQAIDPTGAGNAYGGGWCVGWHRTHDARIAGCYGTVAAALMVSQEGMPDLDDTTRQRAAELLNLALAQTSMIVTSEEGRV